MAYLKRQSYEDLESIRHTFRGDQINTARYKMVIAEIAKREGRGESTIDYGVVNPRDHCPYIFGYSTILPLIWIIVGVSTRAVFPCIRLGIVGTTFMFMGAAALICWLFARRYRRQLTKSEFWRIVAYSAGWAWLIEGFVLVTVIALPEIKSGHFESAPLLFDALLTIVLDTLLIWGAFWKTGKYVIKSYLQRLEANALSPNENA
jgi:hypothetical protein